MLEPYLRWRRQRTIALAFGSAQIAAVTTISYLPKDPAFASPIRFFEFSALGLTLTAGALAGPLLLSMYAKTKLALRYYGAPQPMLAALRYLQDERDAAGRLVAPAVATGLAAGFLQLASLWPQGSSLAPLQPAFVGAMAVSGLATSCLPFWRRTNWINWLFLRRYLGQMSRYVDYKPVTPRRARRKIKALVGPLLVKMRGAVQAGGFNWRWSDFVKKPDNPRSTRERQDCRHWLPASRTAVPPLAWLRSEAGRPDPGRERRLRRGYRRSLQEIRANSGSPHLRYLGEPRRRRHPARDRL